MQVNLAVKLCLILGDQLNTKISSLAHIDKQQDIVLLCEVIEEASYVNHHKKKLVFVFSAMRHFAENLTSMGYQVHYTRLDNPNNQGSFTAEVASAIRRYQATEVVVTEAAEYRVLQMMKTWASTFDIKVSICPDNRFLCSHQGFSQWASERKQLRMEYFYREMRKAYGILMDDDKPVGGQWNYDAENRQVLSENVKIPETYQIAPDEMTQTVIELIAARFDDHFGEIKPFFFAVTREQALDALNQFVQERLPSFGDYQDAMLQGEPWLYHSHISLYLNNGLLLPMECVKAAEEAYREGRAPLNAVEGFIRQIVGWREFVRGIYWLKMPDYAQENQLQAMRPLPDFYWTANTQLNCIKQCVSETRDNAYAHHIQRLMVLGNFALLAGIDPQAVNEWYLLVYADAYEWVELPNVTGMVLFADGGLLASKPYAASGAYINKMSNYCKNCHYDVKQKTGEGACPFNYLYWDFLIRNESYLFNNPRLGMSYRTLAKMAPSKRADIEADSQQFLESIKPS